MSVYQGKTVVISGGAEGIGLDIGRAMGGQGMNVVLADIDTEQLALAEHELKAANIPVLAAPLDVAIESQWQSVAEQAIERFGKVHMLVNNAGVGGIPGEIEDTDDAAWRWAVDVNLMGVVYGGSAIVPLIKQHGEGGWVINVASIAGLLSGSPYSASYMATKHAVVGLTGCWATQLAPHNIHVSVLCPGFVKTRIHKSSRNLQDRYKLTKPFSPLLKDISKHATKVVEDGIDLDIVGKRVLEALEQKEFYILTHPNYREIHQQAAGRLDNACERAANSPLLQHVLDEETTML